LISFGASKAQWRLISASVLQIHIEMLANEYITKKFNVPQARKKFLKRVYAANLVTDKEELFLLRALAEYVFRTLHNGALRPPCARSTKRCSFRQGLDYSW
jgi:hypothetical protein